MGGGGACYSKDDVFLACEGGEDMKRNLLKCLLCVCLTTAVVSGCGKNEAGPESIQEITKNEDAEAAEKETAEGEAVEREAAEREAAEVEAAGAVTYVEPTAEEFTYNYDAALKGIKITGYNGEETAIRIPAEIDGDTVIDVKLVNYDNNNTKVAYIELPDGITSIGDCAFERCGNLTEIEISDSVTSIGRSAFLDCGSLTKIEIPDGVTSIDQSAFYGCKSLTEIKIPDGVTSIEDKTFCHCDSLTEIEIPDSVTTIGHYAFSGCKNLRNITIPDGAEVDHRVFEGCEALTVTYKGEEYTYANDPDNWW